MTQWLASNVQLNLFTPIIILLCFTLCYYFTKSFYTCEDLWKYKKVIFYRRKSFVYPKTIVFSLRDIILAQIFQGNLFTEGKNKCRMCSCQPTIYGLGSYWIMKNIFYWSSSQFYRYWLWHKWYHSLPPV